jgi:hypothetical protein
MIPSQGVFPVGDPGVDNPGVGDDLVASKTTSDDDDDDDDDDDKNNDEQNEHNDDGSQGSFAKFRT